MPKAKRMRMEEQEALATRAAHSMESPVVASSGNQPQNDQNVVLWSEEQLNILAQKVAQQLCSVSAEDIVAKAMVELQSVLAGEYDEILAENKSAIIEVVRQQAETDAKLSYKVAPLVTNEAGPAELEAVMSTILPAEEIQLIKNTFLFETYQVEVYKCSIPGPKSFVSFLRDGENIFPDIALASSEETISASLRQWTSIVIEIFMLVLSAVGIKVSFNKSQMVEITKAVETILKSSSVEKALTAFKNKWAKGGILNRAKAIFFLLKNFHTAGIFWKVMKVILSKMSLLQRMKAIAKVTATIIIAFLTGGASLIAKIVVALKNGVKLVQKLVNLEALDMIQAEQTD